MKTRKIRIIVAALLLCVFGARAQEQEYYTGCLLDDDVYESLPQKALLLTRDYTVLPPRYSLEKYCPTPRSQGFYGTCVGWSTTYAARTIAEAAAYGWTEREKTDSETFSPLYVYLKIKTVNDDCESGTPISDALNILKNEGVAKYKDFDVKCAPSIPSDVQRNVGQYKIDDYSKLFDSEASSEEKIRKTKKALSEDKPVVIGMKCFGSFNEAKDIWNGVTDFSRGGHAMCVIGYDNDKYGGSFRIMNSWGMYWGVGGFTWIKYDDYCKHVYHAYELFVRKKHGPRPGPEPGPLKNVSLAGEIRFELSMGEEMSATLSSSDGMPYYKLAGEYVSGTRYRIYVSNNEPAYVYVIGSDLTNKPNKLFPPDERISPLLSYKSNNIAIPGEKLFMETDDTPGKDYICVLYSYEALPVDEIIEKIKNAPGNFPNKVKTALADKPVPAAEIEYGQKTMRFGVKNTDKTVLPVIVEMTHK